MLVSPAWHNYDVPIYLKSDRQWPRRLRRAHAKYQQRNAKTDTEKRFWKDVIKANSHDGGAK